MAAAVVGEAFLSAFIEVIIDKLASPEVMNIIQGKKVNDTLIQRLKNTLYAVEAVLNDAEQKQIKDSAVNKWLDDLKDAVYVADDILDHISTKAATRKNKEKVQVSTSNFFSRYFNFQDSEREIVCKLENIVARLESILKLKDILGLESFPNLGRLQIYNCENLECFSVSKSLQNLNLIKIADCPNFVSFPREGLSAPSLTIFSIHNCVNLKSLPCHINTLLPMLQYLTIYTCPEVETFSEGGMLPSLRLLRIENCEKLLKNPSLTSMDMLTSLDIGSPCDGLESFPKDSFALLPPSLTSLSLFEFSSLRTLECTRMLHLTSLQQLTIFMCPKLENIAGERLPSSLIKLDIFGCPLLEELCCMKHPQIWPKISHIRGIMVKGRCI